MLRSLISYPYQLCSCLVITKMIQQVPVSCLGLFQHQWVRLGVYGMDCQLGAASVQTVDHGGHTMTCWNLWWDVYLHLGEFSYVNFLYFYGLSFFFFTNLDWYFFSSVLFFLFLSFYLDISFLLIVFVFICFLIVS